MTPPAPGSVIRYAYLWADEEELGREEGRKDRPALVLAIAVRISGDETRVLVLAITHAPPQDSVEAVPVPEEVRRSLGLDADASWVVTAEANEFVWPGPDVRPVPRSDPPTMIYGRVPRLFLVRVAKSYIANRRLQQARIVSRTT